MGDTFDSDALGKLLPWLARSGQMDLQSLQAALWSLLLSTFPVAETLSHAQLVCRQLVILCALLWQD